MNRFLVVLFAGALLAVGCAEDDAAGPSASTTSDEPAVSSTQSNTSTVSTTVTTPPTPSTTSTSTTVPLDQIAWSEIDAERDAQNYLAALAAGAYEQAAWPSTNNGIQMSDANTDEDNADYLERICDGGMCAGPYEVIADGPGKRDPDFGLPSSTVTVTHTATGEQTELMVATFEGQRIVSGLPPLVDSDSHTPLVRELFGEDLPGRVVVQRFDAFEIWEQDRSEWVTNWAAKDTFQVEGDWAASALSVVELRDPRQTFKQPCTINLVDRSGSTLAVSQCDPGGWSVFDLDSGSEVEPPVPYVERFDGEGDWFTERAGVVLAGIHDAEGNLQTLATLDGVDVLGDDYASLATISTDGRHVAYVDHADPNAISHFYSPVLVVRDIATGTEVDRWVLDGVVVCIEFSGDWLLACEGELRNGEFGDDQTALAAIDLNTGRVTRVKTPVRVFLAA